MIIAILFLIGAGLGWYFLGWRMGVEVVGAYVCCLIGSNSPQTFSNSRKALDRIANAAAAKARLLAMKGKM